MYDAMRGPDHCHSALRPHIFCRPVTNDNATTFQSRVDIPKDRAALLFAHEGTMAEIAAKCRVALSVLPYQKGDETTRIDVQGHVQLCVDHALSIFTDVFVHGRSLTDALQVETPPGVAAAKSVPASAPTEAELEARRRALLALPRTQTRPPPPATTAQSASPPRPKRRFDLTPQAASSVPPQLVRSTDAVPPRPPPPPPPGQSVRASTTSASEPREPYAESSKGKRAFVDTSDPDRESDRRAPRRRFDDPPPKSETTAPADSRYGHSTGRQEGGSGFRDSRVATDRDRDRGRDTRGGRGETVSREKSDRDDRRGRLPPQPPPLTHKVESSGKSSLTDTRLDSKQAEVLLHSESKDTVVEAARHAATSELERVKTRLETRSVKECDLLKAAADVLAADDADLTDRLRAPLAANIVKIQASYSDRIAESSAEIAQKFVSKCINSRGSNSRR